MSNAPALLELVVSDLTHLRQPGVLKVLFQVLVIDITLAGDNAIVVGALAAGLNSADRRKVIAIGVVAALVLRVIFALIVTRLLEVVGLVLAGGLLLLWVAWRMWREMHYAGESRGSAAAPGREHPGLEVKSFAGAASAVALADVSMSLDNVVGVASAARDHPGIMILGLIGAVAMMGVAANVIAQYIGRYRWLAWVGIAVILWVAGTMIWEGLTDGRVGVLQLLDRSR